MSIPANSPAVVDIPAGIRSSREALRRDLPALLTKPEMRGRFIAYHRDERLGIAADMDELIRECLRRGLAADDYYIGMIELGELIEEEDLFPRSIPSLPVTEALPTPGPRNL